MRHSRHTYAFLALLILILFPAFSYAGSIGYIDQYNVKWTRPSADASGSMPLGGGDIGCNVWVENGDILFYISRTGTFDENNSMLKLGRIRIRFSPNPFADGFSSFRQELRLKEGYIEFEAVKDNISVKARIWVEVFRPVIHFSAESSENLTMEASYESWRSEDHPISRDERMQCLSFLGTDPRVIPLTTYKDVVGKGPDEVFWYHRNRNDDLVFDKEITQQHLDQVKSGFRNPLKDLTFGGLMKGGNLAVSRYADGSYLGTAYKGWVMKSAEPSSKHSLLIVLHTSQAASAEAWKSELESELSSLDDENVAWSKNFKWWASFWDRSHIVINNGAGPEDQGWRIGRNYQLFRYMLACNAYGEYPSKFNGGLFTFDPGLTIKKYQGLSPDFRQWGGGSFTAQNQRLVYWPMLKSGDFSFMHSQFSLYSRNLAAAELRTKTYWKHGGASYGEHLESFGLPIGDIYQYGWGQGKLGPRNDSASTRMVKDSTGNKIKVQDYGYLDNDWVSDEYDNALEFAFMVLEYQRFSAEDISGYLPFVASCVRFYDEHYQYWAKRLYGKPLDAKGKLILYPSTALETYKIALNPTPVIAALRSVLTSLLALPVCYGSPEQRKYWKELLERVPEIPFRTMKGKTVIAPAESWEFINNIELPQLYPVFPYGLFGIAKPLSREAVDTWYSGADNGNQYGYISWHQDAIFCARLGLWEEAKDLIVKKLDDGPLRFPAFWGPGHDWTPDHNWGGSGMIALQECLLQTIDSLLYVMPTWPPEWNVDFKLHAPEKTTVEATAQGRKLMKMKVVPAARKSDVIMMNVVSPKKFLKDPGQEKTRGKSSK
ncbi:MAG: DUF5703 domain-containing protein [Bacteroidota bacterium]|jgi:Domain of unknown function (DUF5703)